MTDIVFIFEVHQPFRIKRDFFWKKEAYRKVRPSDLFDYYFDNELNREIFQRICRKCYFPATSILLETIDKYRKEKRKAKFSFSLSGTFLDQCEVWNKDLLDRFKQLAKSGCIEFLSQTYYHSLACLYENKEEFIEQTKLHQQTIKDLLGIVPQVFENTELIYNNEIAKKIEELGFIGIVAEGSEKMLEWRSPNYVYRPKGCGKLKVLLRNYRLTDDIGFRFSAKWWSEWPLTADKYASWLASAPGDVIVIFPDFESFGEHHWRESGILDFLRYLPEEILKQSNLNLATPSEVINKYEPVGEIDVPVNITSSWAGFSRDLGNWLENPLQRAYFLYLQHVEPLVRESEEENLLNIWRYLQTSDHLHNMYTMGRPEGIVHEYFSHFESPSHAYINYHSIIMDFERKVRDYVIAADDPFLFFEGIGNYTGLKTYSLSGLKKAIEKTSLKSLRFHTERGDFEKWALSSLHDERLAKKFRKIKSHRLIGRKLRIALRKAITKRFQELRHNYLLHSS